MPNATSCRITTQRARAICTWRVARFIETKLITEKGHSNSYIREEAVPAHLSEEELNPLIDSRLVRIEDRYAHHKSKLTDDVLTDAVREHRY